MREGESFKCPHCGEQSIVKSKNRMDGFTLVGKVFACVLCGAELEAPDGNEQEPEGGQAAARFAALLGEGAQPEEKADLAPDEGYGRFCRNCIHFIEHPFRTLCGLDGKVADPMGECGQFRKRD